ncbi:hypothetical protein G6016_08600 [Dietzia aerolata]|nr:hypothetical protein [Dietzia aerolata]
MLAMTYAPPTPKDISDSQNQEAQLRLLRAVRRLYSKAKFWANVRGVGLGVVAVVAPLTVAVKPDLATTSASVAAAWFVLNRLVFRPLERSHATRAATVQEQFDSRIFGMPTIAVRDPQVLPEEVTRLTGKRLARRKAFSDDRLRDWYPINKAVPGPVAVAIAQRGNLAYTQELLRRSANLWAGVVAVWAVAAFVIGLVADFTLENFLLAIVLPVLPPLLDAADEWQRVRAAGKERRALTIEIQDAIHANSQAPISGEQLLGWQSQLFSLRRDSPLVPDWLYSILRSGIEREMKDTAKSLGGGS